MIKAIDSVVAIVIVAVIGFAAWKFESIRGENAVLKANEKSDKESERLNDTVSTAARAGETAKGKTAVTVIENKLIVRDLAKPGKLLNSAEAGNTSCQAERNQAEAYRVVFGECAERLVEMADIADDHAISQEVLSKAFPSK